jgi:hypothetical protein
MLFKCCAIFLTLRDVLFNTHNSGFGGFDQIELRKKGRRMAVNLILRAIGFSIWNVQSMY